MTENDNQENDYHKLIGASRNAPQKAQESIDAPAKNYNGSQDAPAITGAKVTQVSSKITAND